MASPISIIIVGAGPSGLILGLLLAKQGIRVQILDAANELNKQPRASHYGPPAVDELRRAGIVEDLDGTYITGVKNKHTPAEQRMLCLPLDQLMQIIGKHIARQPTAEILYSHKVVYYPDIEKFNWEDSNFIIHPEHCFMAAKIQTDGLYRVTYLEKSGLSREEYLERQPKKFETFLPGHPTPDKYNIVNFSPYKIHQRCADKFRVGRFLLAADAAHLCNPFGGLGLTGGLVDVGNLYDCLYGIATGQADDSILDKYDTVRRQMYHEVIDPISTSNLRRLLYTTEEEIEKDEFYNMVKRAETDDEFSRQLQTGINVIKHDFTQYYKQKPAVEAPTKDIRAELPKPAVVSAEG
ncbi:hypothetical protein H2203_003191 [Taxawa tesnikishii (nom. ined.)]|nr:hypothetical protein H2203_003191 [Dothideales sp. JES 119]